LNIRDPKLLTNTVCVRALMSQNIMTSQRWSKYRWSSPNKATCQGLDR